MPNDGQKRNSYWLDRTNHQIEIKLIKVYLQQKALTLLKATQKYPIKKKRYWNYI